MAHDQYLRCDNPSCTKQPIKHNLSSLDVPKGWRLGVGLPFSLGHPGGASEVDVCSPGCLKAIINANIDQEWEKDDRGITGAIVPAAGPRKEWRHPVEQPAKTAVEVAPPP